MAIRRAAASAQTHGEPNMFKLTLETETYEYEDRVAKLSNRERVAILVALKGQATKYRRFLRKRYPDLYFANRQ